MFDHLLGLSACLGELSQYLISILWAHYLHKAISDSIETYCWILRGSFLLSLTLLPSLGGDGSSGNLMWSVELLLMTSQKVCQQLLFAICSLRLLCNTRWFNWHLRLDIGLLWGHKWGWFKDRCRFILRSFPPRRERLDQRDIWYLRHIWRVLGHQHMLF